MNLRKLLATVCLFVATPSIAFAQADAAENTAARSAQKQAAADNYFGSADPTPDMASQPQEAGIRPQSPAQDTPASEADVLRQALSTDALRTAHAAGLSLGDARYYYNKDPDIIGYEGWFGSCAMTMMVLDVVEGAVTIDIDRNNSWQTYPDAIRSQANMFAYSLYNDGDQGFILNPTSSGTKVTAFFYCFTSSGNTNTGGGSGGGSATTTSTLTWNITDACNDGYRIEYRFFDKTNDLVWPGSSTVYYTSYYNTTYTNRLECRTGAKICYGAKTGNSYWGIGINGTEGCTDCCTTCTTATVANRLGC